jgi:ribosomal protein S12 methylthiotransferase
MLIDPAQTSMKTDQHPAGQRVFLLSLGCAKNLVDSECMSRLMKDAGHVLVERPELADILVVNTCGFIESAKREAIGAILEMAGYKAPAGQARFLVVTGCLVQRYALKIKQELPEVDAVLGTADYALICETIQGLVAGNEAVRVRQPGMPGSLAHLATERDVSVPGRFAYLKIAEGCSNCCSYCAIPVIRGPLRSRPLEEVVREAENLSAAGRDEIILIAQDTTRYGEDLYGRPRLVDLLDQICRLPEVRLVRILYVYADSITADLIRIMAAQPKIAHYLDMPIQHAADRLLGVMNRRDSQAGLRRVIAQLRQAMPDLILRTTVMVGFPGESEEDFAELLAFLREMKFDRLGCFIYSPEEGTPACSLRPRIRAPLARKRQKAVMELQQEITAASNRSRVGREYPVALESIDDRGIFFIGRSYGEAPEVDPVIFVASSTGETAVGQTRLVRLVEASGYDMTGVTVA